MRGLHSVFITTLALTSMRPQVASWTSRMRRSVSTWNRQRTTSLIRGRHLPLAISQLSGGQSTTHRSWMSTAAHEVYKCDNGTVWGVADNKLIEELAELAGYELQNNVVDSEGLLRHTMELFHSNKNLPKQFIMKLLDHSMKTHKLLPNVLQVRRPQAAMTEPTKPLYTGNLTVVGDVHGQYADFATIFEDAYIGGFPSASNQFIFNGDLVDRGSKALEIVTTLLLAKLLYPGAVHILRGNHETEMMFNNYGFKKEVLSKYDYAVLRQFGDFFNTLPIAAVVENLVFVVHGGLGRKSVHLTVPEIDELDRLWEPEYAGVISELLWSDPRDNMQGFTANPDRGGNTVCFGADVTESFLARNNLQLLIRSHEVEMQGYKVLHNGLCLTVFSAPNYCGDVGNLGAVIRFEQPDSMRPSVKQFMSAAQMKVVLAQQKAAAEAAVPPQ